MKRLTGSMMGVVFVAIMVAGLMAEPALAKNIHKHFVFRNETQTFTGNFKPCAKGRYTITITFSGHVNILKNPDTGKRHVTETMHGTFVADPLTDPSLPSFSGSFTQWDGFNLNPGGSSNFTFTIHIHAQGSDGSSLKLHEVVHAVIDSDGNIKIFFDKPTCH